MKKYSFIIILLFVSIISFAGIVPIETARKVAVNFYYERANAEKPVSLASIKITKEFTELQNSTAVYYIFNIGLDKGYVIVSAESNTIPVLAYSFEKNYYTENISPAFKWIVKSYKNEILETRDKNLSANEEINNLWSTYSNFTKSTSSISVVAPLLSSISWDQSCYYNALCPVDVDPGYCNHVPTGCVATAMAMIMKYHVWPAQGQGSYTYVHSGSGFTNNYGTLTANFGTATYNWASIPDNVISANAEVAKVMFHCGVAVEMSYDINGSGAAVGPANASWPTAQKAFVNYFKYPTAAYFAKAGYTDAAWKTRIKTDIDASRPIFYGGDDGSAGHAFVLDGYQGTLNDFYHFNFGWSGYSNGYFYITSINPGTGGAGGGTYNFTLNQEGIFSIAKATTGIEDIQSNASIDIYPNPSNGLFNLNLSNISDSKLKLEVYNLMGEKVWQSSFNTENSTINLTSLSKGIYYLSVKSSNTTITKKITIIK